MRPGMPSICSRVRPLLAQSEGRPGRDCRGADDEVGQLLCRGLPLLAHLPTSTTPFRVWSAITRRAMLGTAPSAALTSVRTADSWPSCSVFASVAPIVTGAAIRSRSHSSIVSPYRWRNVAPWLWPWSETMTIRYGRGQVSMLLEPREGAIDALERVERLAPLGAGVVRISS